MAPAHSTLGVAGRELFPWECTIRSLAIPLAPAAPLWGWTTLGTVGARRTSHTPTMATSASVEAWAAFERSRTNIHTALTTAPCDCPDLPLPALVALAGLVHMTQWKRWARSTVMPADASQECSLPLSLLSQGCMVDRSSLVALWRVVLWTWE